MPKDPSPLLGYNNNIRHKDRVFHVQTEDSGVRHPHVITHLFMDGGRILKSVKTSYADKLGADKMADLVQKMMKDQHKAMLVALRAGEYDHIVEAPPVAKSGGAPPVRPEPKSAAAGNKPALSTAETELAMPATVRTKSIRPVAKTLSDPITTQTLVLPEELTLDIEALERAAVENSSPMFQPSDLPPPPANLFRERGPGGGAYRSVPPPSLDDPHSPPRLPGYTPPPQSAKFAPSRLGRGSSSRPPPPLRRGLAPKPASRAPARSRSSPPSIASAPLEGRHVPARPPATFGQNRPQRGNSIFGEDLISDKSLDEVILSYLAEDLDSPSTKKKK
jgi:hypothetical protein